MDPSPARPEARRPWEHAVAGVLFLVSAILFWPATEWLAHQTLAHDQLKNAFIVLGFAGAFLIMERRTRLPLQFELGSRSAGLIATGFVLTGLGLALHLSVLILAAFSCVLAGWVLYVFGDRIWPAIRALLGVFLIYTLFVMLFPFADWPLRTVAGVMAGKLLALLGYGTQLALVQQNHGTLHLVLIVNSRPFEVAPECNGFGMVASSVLVGMLMLIPRRASWWGRMLVVLGAFLLGLASNTLRILAICMLAPRAGSSYLLMHETVGILFFWGTLVLIWWSLTFLPERRLALEKVTVW
jgi:exosortase/archaeosortase family protein